MNDPDLQLDRLLRAAAAAKEQARSDNEMPFGFDTRVVTLAQSEQKQDLVAVGRLLRRVILVSLGVIVIAGAGVYNDLRQSDDPGTTLTDEYAIADNAIGTVFDQ